MTTTQTHTPGPWEVDRTENYYKPCIRHNGMIVAWLPVGSKVDDAALIAAAPELLEALEYALSSLDAIRDLANLQGYALKEHGEASKRIRTAIASATPGAQAQRKAKGGA